MGFQMGEVRRLAADLLISDERVRDAAKAAIKKGAVNIKRDSIKMIISAVGAAHAKHYAKSITFDIKDQGLTAEIGPQIGRSQAFLGKILEFGTATSGAHPHMIPALEAEKPRLEQGLMLAIDKALGS